MTKTAPTVAAAAVTVAADILSPGRVPRPRGFRVPLTDPTVGHGIFSIWSAKGYKHHMCCRALTRSWKSAHENQELKQVTVASSTTPPEVLDRLYSVPYSRQQTLFNQELNVICEENDGKEIITIPEFIADVICNEKEYAFVGKETESKSEDPEALCCNGGATSSLSSSFNN
jgi:hypothetical protein